MCFFFTQANTITTMAKLIGNPIQEQISLHIDILYSFYPILMFLNENWNFHLHQPWNIELSLSINGYYRNIADEEMKSIKTFRKWAEIWSLSIIWAFSDSKIVILIHKYHVISPISILLLIIYLQWWLLCTITIMIYSCFKTIFTSFTAILIHVNNH